MDINIEFNTKFDNEDYIITIQSNSLDKLIITIEEEANTVFWKKELDSKIIGDITSQMGSYKSLEVFTKMLLCALRNENENITLNFCSLNEIQMLSENKKSNPQSLNLSKDKENNIKKYLMLVYTQFEKVVYPIQLDYLGQNPEMSMLYKTIHRLKEKIKDLNESGVAGNQASESKSNFNDSKFTVNFNDYEKLKKENQNLISKIKILETYRPMGAVENDDIYKNYAAVSEEYMLYKQKTESKIKMLLKSIEEIKENQNKETKINFNEKDKSRSKIKELEEELIATNETLNDERRQAQNFIDEKNKQIEVLKREIKVLKEADKAQKAKISRLERDLDKSVQASNYYRYGTPKSNRSYKTASIGSYNGSYASGFSGSRRSNISYIKKNLIPSRKVVTNQYSKYVRDKNYKPFSFINKKKLGSNQSSKHSSVASKSRSKSKGPSSYKSGSSSKGKNINSGTSNFKSKYTSYGVPKSTYSSKFGKNATNKPFSKPKVRQGNSKGSLGKNKTNITRANKVTTTTNKVTTNTNNMAQNPNFSSTINSFMKGENNLTSTLNSFKKGESINVAERLGRLQDLINQANKQ